MWVLHLGYLVAREPRVESGLSRHRCLLGLGLVSAMGLGVASTMVVAVITRAALGHTGRPLVVSKSVAVAYGALGAAALARALVPVLSDWREWGIWLSALLWSAAFAVVLFNYAPILLRPRVDGRPG